MGKRELLLKYYDQACHNLLCYSRRYLMDEPKEGYETEWQQANEECRLLDEMIKEAALDGKQDLKSGYISRDVFESILNNALEKFQKSSEQFQRDLSDGKITLFHDTSQA